MRILIVDDHPMFRWGVRQFITSLPGAELVGEASDGTEALALLTTTPIDVVLLDLEMPGLDGIGFLATLNQSSATKPKIIILSQSSSDAACRKLQDGGIDGYILKTEGIGEIGNALASLGRGESYFSPGVAKRLWDLLQEITFKSEPPCPSNVLTKREMEVAHLVKFGMSTRGIAERLGCTVNTIKTHRANVMHKIGAKNAADLARWFTSLEAKN